MLKDFQVIDGCCEMGETIDFRLPLRGAASKLLTPTVKNVQNKFSVRFFVRIVLQTTALYRVQTDKKQRDEEEEEDDKDDSFEHLSEHEEDLDMESNLVEVVLWR